MAEVDLTIGGRTFRVACADGEERALESAASHLAREATLLTDAIGKVPESRMLLMSGLMLADRQLNLTADLKSAEEKHRVLEQRAERAEAEAARLRAEPPASVEPVAQPEPQADMFPPEDNGALEALATVAEELEALADHLEQRAAS
ncbi:cell division protein ZapA [Pontivivens insulae]|uniref:Cell division protein ZapA n=1 Tax=Pontivivens insulae TaxID=1639689 RepID=A0A2R8AAS9_9RHOB|nr:cell division protein ZapA [Pontivivens insulae]RED13106.1 cell division protein ZapA [Pontivivens insulae]SPF29198.1 hypothetical protein POI8812_01505 [Pontivivens insulae]